MPYASAKAKAERLERLQIANKFILIIAGYGRHFFHYKGRYTHFEFDSRGRVVLFDKYTEKMIFVGYKGRWYNFSDGGTLRMLIEALRDYINGKRDLPLNHLGPWPESCCGGDLWGYGDEMQTVREECAKLKEAAGS